MPRKKKRPRDWTTEEMMQKLFPKKARDQLSKEVADQQKRSIKKKST